MSSSDLIAGRYRLTRQLGQGSFAETYLAEDTALARPVAVKILRSQYAQDERFALRFEREARAAAAVRHQNVVDVYDYGQDDSTLFMVMEWVDGPNLKEYLRGKGQLAPNEAARIMRDVLQGLQAVHDAGIIHRDVKPQNVIVDQDGTAKISDFGVARGALDAGLTDTGMALGTAAYMAPEQARAAELSPATDLYAAGVLLFEILTGRLPFPGENPLQVMYQHVNEQPPDPRQLNASIPEGLALIVMKALAKEPSDRFGSAREMLNAIEQPPGNDEATRIMAAAAPDQTQAMAAGAAGGRRPPPPGRRARQQPQRGPMWPLVLVIGLLILFALAALAFLASQDDDDEVPVVEPTATPTVEVVAPEEPTPTPEPTPEPEPTPTPTPTPEPTPTPTPEPTPTPTPEPTPTPTPEPEPTPTPEPTSENSGVGTELGSFEFGALVVGAPSAQMQGTDFDGTFQPGEGSNVPQGASLLFSQATDFDEGEAEFESEQESSLFVGVEMSAMTDPASEALPIELTVNDVVVFRGPSPFSNDEVETVRWVFRDTNAIEDGDNEVVIRNLAEQGAAGEPPWLLVESVTVYYR